MNLLRAEFRKILSVRSTYLLLFIVVVLPVILVCGVIYGYNNVNAAGINPNVLKQALLQSVGISSLLLSFLAVISVCHEYRYNTILYSLTSVGHRSKFYIAKAATLTGFGFVIGFIAIGLAAAAFYIGLGIRGIESTPQSIPDTLFIGRLSITLLASMLFAFCIALIVRSFIGCFAVILLLPTTIEPILSVLLKDNARYLPFTALSNMSASNPTSLQTSFIVLLAYIVGLGLISYGLFIQRDAN